MIATTAIPRAMATHFTHCSAITRVLADYAVVNCKIVNKSVYLRLKSLKEETGTYLNANKQRPIFQTGTSSFDNNNRCSELKHTMSSKTGQRAKYKT